MGDGERCLEDELAYLQLWDLQNLSSSGIFSAFHQADRRAALQEEAYHLNVRKLEQGLISTIDFQKASDNWLNAKTSRLDALLKFYIKRSVVNYYNGISYINQ